MGQKDLAQKLLEDYPDVFADIFNVLLFQGEQIICADELEKTANESQYKADTSDLHEERRDLLKLWIKGKNKALLGIENQMDVDDHMPIRIIGYDGVSYRSQLLKGWKGNHCPVITLVLYYGDKSWDQPSALAEELPELENLHGSDYQFHVFHIPDLTDEQIQMFQSDFRIVAEFFAAQKRGQKYRGSRKKIQHVDEMLKFMKVFTDDERFMKVTFEDEQKEDINMCMILDQIEEEGRQKGKSEGIQLLSDLITILMKQGKMEELQRAAQDRTYCEQLLKEYQLL
ncbi:MAG TPA: Rpn family recombination-promoting nuclease/putative transposase [Candidatus Anaerostipes avistercoris]|uniref:Rpn family recombination-promoting nuclease/putative transposase n=1 Tax=Candidatus Anaerostipes avistercoris TaxID=2838462 RepID=A0A9D2PHE3_9FIRM|nr:Rpn family recombination-promoting nuclease/putative transposase [Candidatus Anaerostipes avistercoris]